jgi:hypothetical protein
MIRHSIRQSSPEKHPGVHFSPEKYPDDCKNYTRAVCENPVLSG